LHASSTLIRGISTAVAASALLTGGCVFSGADDDGPAPAERARTATAADPAARADLGVVGLDARIGDVRRQSAGVIVDADRGLIVTSAHSLWGARSLKVATGLGVLHGRILARDACDDLAVVETQPRIPGLVAVSTGGDTPLDGRAVQSAYRAGAAAGGAPLTTRRVAVGNARAALASGLAPRGARQLAGPLPPVATGAPLLSADGRLAGLALVVRGAGGVRRAALPWSVIAARMRELRSGDRAVYVGWSRHYRCAPAMHRFAAAAYPGFERTDAVLNAAVPAARLPGTKGLR
jgi:S1-C subfamily serine protease